MLILSSLKAKLLKYIIFGNTLQLQTVIVCFIERITEVRIKRRGCCDIIFL